MHKAVEAGALTHNSSPILTPAPWPQRNCPPRHVAVIGTFPPRQCGIATFTADIVEQLGIHHPEIRTEVYAVDGTHSELVYSIPRRVIRTDDEASWIDAVRELNGTEFDAVWLQHEFGIFGSNDGEAVCRFAEALTHPLVITFHTVLAAPSPSQMRIIQRLLATSVRVMVMSQHGRNLLTSRYAAPPDKIHVIEHGAPDRPFRTSEHTKRSLGLAGCDVLMTFGLLGPGKGLERVIEALPAIRARHPRTVYRIVGATHPNLLAQNKESYREGLQTLALRLGVADHVQWDNRFLETSELLDQLAACDIYLTPYPNLDQATSGTLSYAVALGRAVVSTPYVHARELLAEGVGILVETGAPDAIYRAVSALLDDRKTLAAMQKAAYLRGRRTIWSAFARSAADLLNEAVRASKPASARRPAIGNAPSYSIQAIPV